MNKKIKLLLVCFVFGIIFKSKAQQTSFAVGNTTQNERNSKMSDRNGNLIIAGIVTVDGDDVINITETTTSGNVVRTDNYTLSLPNYTQNVVGEFIADMIIDQNQDIVIYGRFLFEGTGRPEPFILKIDGNNRNIIFTTTLRINGSNGLFRGFTPGRIIEYHDGIDNFYYVSAVTYSNVDTRWVNGQNVNNTNLTYIIGGLARLYISRIDFTTGIFNRNLELLERTTQENDKNNIDHSNSGIYLASNNRIFVYGYYGNSALKRVVKPYIYRINPSLLDNGIDRGILEKYYYNSTGIDQVNFREGIHKIIQVPNTSNEFYIYGYDIDGNNGNFFRTIISRVTLTPPLNLGNQFGTISISNFLFKSNLNNTNRSVSSFGDIIVVPNTNNVLFSYTEANLNLNTFSNKIISFDGSSANGETNWSITSRRNNNNEASSTLILNNKIFSISTIINNSSNDYYVFNPQINANSSIVTNSNLCFINDAFPRENNLIEEINLSNLTQSESNTNVEIFSEQSNPISNSTIYPCLECIASDPTNSFIIPTGTILTEDELWGRIGTAQKYYIEGELTVDNAILDITNIDVVFGPCGRINFINNGRLRANNSVFRSCNENRFWDGIYFAQSLNNKIESCVFKNASVGLRFNLNSNGNISNNQFLNCYRGIEINGNLNFNNPISNNKFIIDRLLPTTNECINNIPALNCFGIMMNNSLITAEVSQNQFLYTIDPTRNILVTGIHAINSSFSASLNVFTNMYRSFEVNGDANGAWKIINNSIDFSRIYNGNINLSNIQAHQIYVTGTINNLNNEISKNTIRKSTAQIIPNTFAVNIDGTGVIRISNITIRENFIEGFNYGIYALNTSNLLITKNDLKNITFVGILFHESNNMVISCNTIDMIKSNSSTIRGIQLSNCNYENNENVGKIHSNCIFNTERGIYIIYSKIYSTPVKTPQIKNNYIYNYTLDGIYIRNMSSEIGNLSFDGMNSFISNNNTALDINLQNISTFGPNGIVTQYKNYSNKPFVFSSNIIVPNYTVNYIKYSVASCANQNQQRQSGFNFNGQYDNTLDCESRILFYSTNTGAIGTPQELSVNIKNKNEIIEKIYSEKWTSSDLSKSIKWSENIMNNNNLSANDKSYTLYALFLNIGDLEKVKAIINENKNNSDFFYLEAVKLGIEDINYIKLNTISQNDDLSQTCNFLMNFSDYNYKFNSKILIVDDTFNISTEKSSYVTNLNIYPNPTSDNTLYIDINTPNSNGYKNISITNFMGLELTNSEVYLNNGTTSIDISTYSTGIYYLTMKDEYGNKTIKKFVKL